MPKKATTQNRVNAQILELFWARDLDDARHAAIRVTHADGWTALFYEHPSDGWQVTEIVIEHYSQPDARGESDRVYLDSLSSPDAASEFERLVGMIVTTEPLDGLANDLYELGRRGANRRWKKRYIALAVNPAGYRGEVSRD